MVVAVQDVARRDVFSRTFVEQLVDVAALGSGMKRNTMWHVPQNVYMKYCTNRVVRGMRSAERRNVNVLEIKFLRSMVGVSRIDRVRYEELE